MTPEPLLRRLREDIVPSEEQRARVFSRIQSRINAPAMFEEVKKELTPSEHQKSHLWNTVLNKIEVPQVSGVLDRLKSFFEPSDAQRYVLRDRLMSRLAPVQVRSSYVRTKWAAAFVLVLVALRASPVLFLAPRTIAESAVIVVPTKGEVEVALHDLWQPATTEINLNDPVQLRTAEGEATVLLHDDGTVRLDTHTTLALHDLSDRPEPALDGPTMTLSHGRVWIQGLLPTHLRGITVATPYGDITVHAGSVSVAVDETSATVRVWDRHAVLMHAGVETALLSGERARFGSGDERSITSMADDEYGEAWVTQNLQRDAVHQREVAQMQQERRAAQAGILPNSPLYSVKRVAEKVDVLFTFNSEIKLQKQLDLASTRLDEAAALIAEGSEGADVQLEEYKQALFNIASGTGGSSITQFMLRQEVAENTADVSAALPDDAIYQLKRTVLEASAELPVDTVDASDVEGIVLIDTLDVLHQAIEEGDTARAQQTYNDLQPYLSGLENGALKPAVRKEVLTLIEDAAEKLEQKSGSGEIANELIDELKPYIPVQKPEVAIVPLTDEQIDSMIERMRSRIFVYTQPRSRWNQLQYEMKQISGHPDEGRILRRLYHALPEDGLARYVRPAIQELREETNQ